MNIRQFKKRYYLCKDDFGNKLYPGDTVELWMPIETKHPYQTRILWNMVDGAFVDPHPAHAWMEHAQQRRLRSFLDQSAIKKHHDWESEEFEMEKGYCKKVKSVWNTHKK